MVRPHQLSRSRRRDRLTQDEFAVIVEAVSSAEELRSRAFALLAAAEEPVQVAGLDVSLRRAPASP